MEYLALVVALSALLVAVLRKPPPPAEPPVVAVADTPAALTGAMSTSLRHVAVVRYDSTPDVAGRQSFTAALLDDRGEGLVITSLYTRTESRTLIKGIVAGEEADLSPEEFEAVRQAQGANELGGE